MMYKQSKSVKQVPQNKGGKEGGYSYGVPAHFQDYNPLPLNPMKQQFEPTAAEPVRQRYRMAGGC